MFSTRISGNAERSKEPNGLSDINSYVLFVIGEVIAHPLIARSSYVDIESTPR